jgi:hypothetical protein
MHVSLVTTLVYLFMHPRHVPLVFLISYIVISYLFMHPRHVPLVFLISYIVIYGHPLFLVSLDSNTTRLYLIFRITYGRSLCDLSLTRFLLSLTSSLMWLPSSAPPSRPFSATTTMSSTTQVPARSSSLMVLISECHVPTPPHRTIKPSVLFVPQTISFAPSCFRPLFYLLLG